MTSARHRLRRSAAVLLTGTLIATGLVALQAGPAGAAPAVCTDGSLVTDLDGRDNGDGTTSIVVVGTATAATPTATVTIPIGVQSLRLDVCGAQGQAGTGSDGGAG